MFDIAFSELVLIGAVALVVIGPERLPKVARTAGHLFGRLQRYVSDVKADINRELKLEELRKLESEFQEKAKSAEHVILEETRSAGGEVKAVAEQVAAPLQMVTTAVPDQPMSPAETAAEPHLASPQLELGLEAEPGVRDKSI